MKFFTHPNCELCSLCQSARNPGLPTRGLYGNQPPQKDKAILFVGQSPGFTEDEKGEIFIGYTGQVLKGMVETAKLADYCDIYLSNACRCKPPQGGDVSQSQIRACRGYLQQDVAELQNVYSEVIIVALGAKACYSVLNKTSLTNTLKNQGQRSKFFGEQQEGPRVFATYHPAMLHPKRKPGLIRAVEVHFSLLLRYLQGGFIPNELDVVPEVGIPAPKKLSPIVTVDIETYGILKGKEQTVFHPIKSKEVDGIDYKDQIVTVGFSWEDENGKLRTPIYIFNRPNHRRIIRQWFRRMSQEGIVCTGQNTKFDLLYLFFCGGPELQYWIDPRRLVVDDTMIWSFLLNEQQPEKGLKELSMLYGIADYSAVKVSGKSGNAKSPKDKNLHYYNAFDNATTFALQRDLRRRISERFGPESPKLSDTCSQMRNTIIWDTFDLEKNGSAFDVTKIEAFHNKQKNRSDEIFTLAEMEYGIKLAGTGSDAPLRQLMYDALNEADMLLDSRVAWSEKTGKISIGVENVNLAKTNLPPGSIRSGVRLLIHIRSLFLQIPVEVSSPEQGILELLIPVGTQFRHIPNEEVEQRINREARFRGGLVVKARPAKQNHTA